MNCFLSLRLLFTCKIEINPSVSRRIGGLNDLRRHVCRAQSIAWCRAEAASVFVITVVGDDG